MSNWNRFWIGGGGALLPLFVTLLAIDLTSIIDHAGSYTIGTYVGTAIRYFVLFALGGIVAALNYDEVQPIKLVQLGIAAPALIASYVNAQQPAKIAQTTTQPPRQSIMLDLSPIATAHAMDYRASDGRIVLAASFLSDVLEGATRPLPKMAVEPRPRDGALERAIIDARQSAAEAAAAADKAKADAARAAVEPSRDSTSAAQRSATDSLNAAQKANSDILILEDVARTAGATR